MAVRFREEGEGFGVGEESRVLVQFWVKFLQILKILSDVMAHSQ
jgi:hypothetical protein